MPPNKPDRMRGVRHGIERDFAFERFLWQGLSMQRRYGQCRVSIAPHVSFELFKNRGGRFRKRRGVVEIVALQCLAPLVDLVGKARKIETNTDRSVFR